MYSKCIQNFKDSRIEKFMKGIEACLLKAEGNYIKEGARQLIHLYFSKIFDFTVNVENYRGFYIVLHGTYMRW